MRINIVRFMFGCTALLCFSAAAIAEEEQGIKYSCDSEQQELRIQSSFAEPGNDDKDPFEYKNTETKAQWNIDRLHEPLPIIRNCTIGKHLLTTVVRKACAAGQGGWVPQVEVFVDLDVVADKGGSLSFNPRVYLDRYSDPLVASHFFGSTCDGESATFGEILIRSDGHNFSVQMK